MVFINSIESNMAGRLVMSYHLFMTPCFVDTLVENQAYSVVTHVFDTIRCSNMEQVLMFQLMHYLVLIIAETGFQHQLVEMGFFDTFNEYFGSFDVTEVMKLYDVLVMCKESRKVDYEIVKFICKMYHMESYGVDNMVKVLEHVREQKSSYLVCPEQFMPEKWFDEKSKLHNEMAFDLWRGSNDGNSSSSVAGDLVGEAIPRLWIHQVEESEAQFVKEYLGGGRAINGRYLDIWLRHPELARGCQILLEMRCGSWCCVDKFYPNLDWPEVCKCDSCGACVKETLEHRPWSTFSFCLTVGGIWKKDWPCSVGSERGLRWWRSVM